MSENTPFQYSLPFLEYLAGFQAGLPVLTLEEVVREPERVAIVSVDVTNGFCYEGPLASPRVKGIIAPIVRLFEKAWSLGVRHILLPHDAHEPEAVEFGQYPPHCVRGSAEAEPVPEFKALPFFNQMLVMPKNSIQTGLDAAFSGWVASHPEVVTYIVVGDCTDLCTYQLAMHLRLEANARQLQRRVVLPADCVETYDLPVALARQIGAMPHDGNLLHAVFLYHMALNGVEVVKSLR
jgi:nicotinamidase-related amidase